MQYLKQRAKFIRILREFFDSRGYLEVDTPILAKSANPDPMIDNIEVGRDKFLQTSPEFHMKRLLTQGSGPIYQITRAFRGDEAGQYHLPEFTILEWYQLDFDHHDLMTEVSDLLTTVLGTPPADKISYDNLFLKYLTIAPDEITEDFVKKYIDINTDNLSHDDCLNLLLTHQIEPNLQDPIMIYDYPASQAALAKIKNNRAQRFEAYYQGLELANGFHELTDPKVQLARFKAQNQQRANPLPIDYRFIKALEQGLPNCAGVALGVDRLFMLSMGIEHIKDAVSFSE